MSLPSRSLPRGPDLSDVLMGCRSLRRVLLALCKARWTQVALVIAELHLLSRLSREEVLLWVTAERTAHSLDFSCFRSGYGRGTMESEGSQQDTSTSTCSSFSARWNHPNTQAFPLETRDAYLLLRVARDACDKDFLSPVALEGPLLLEE